ncbi:MAG: ABC transporter substrate-binding protein [Lachnospiraceae bacterium]|nr:ABC transporter substrate-binding protein [Lachnospiraceae bacterium]
MKHKKLMALLLATCMVMGTVGCGGGSSAPAAPPAADGGTDSAAADNTQAESGSADASGATSTGGDLVRGGVGDGQYKESPLIHELVEKGELPPIEERLPKEPAVVEVDEIGVYGGTYVGAAFGPTSGQVDTECLRYQSILTIEKDLKTFKPNLIQSFDVNEDSTEFTIHLREGMKWSNGDPFTTADWMFWLEDILLNTDVNAAVDAAFCSNGIPMAYEPVDDYTLVIRFEESNPAFEITMARFSTGLIRNFFAPKEYLQKWHITYNPDADKLAKEEGYESWILCFKDHLDNSQSQKDCEAPDLYPWVLDRIDTNGNKFFARNPYYHVVDQEGNQLPYIDEQEAMIVQDKDVRNLKLISGEIHAAGENPLPVSDYTMLKENEAAGDYQVFLFENTRGSDCAFTFNITDQNPDLREVFTNVKFRQAMSHALDRNTINETLYYGKGSVRQTTASADTSFMKDEFENAFIEYDVDKANALLDECGYEWNAAHTVRIMPNGEEFNIILETIEEFVPVAEMACEYWTAVGVKVTLKQEERSYYLERGKNNERDMQAFTLDSVGEFNLRSVAFSRLRPGNAYDDLEFMRAYKDYWDSNGSKGEQPPEDIQQLYEDCLKFGTLTNTDPEYAPLGESILQRISDQCWFIGVSVSPRLVIISNRLGNTPTEGTFANDYNFWKPFRGDTWYFKY